MTETIRRSTVTLILGNGNMRVQFYCGTEIEELPYSVQIKQQNRPTSAVCEEMW